eukprot:Amastigsp_a343922_8.p5 type:complete len:103 gc:universal Amastigsp_a343922_8:992-1300(+)
MLENMAPRRRHERELGGVRPVRPLAHKGLHREMLRARLRIEPRENPRVGAIARSHLEGDNEVALSKCQCDRAHAPQRGNADPQPGEPCARRKIRIRCKDGLH